MLPAAAAVLVALLASSVLIGGRLLHTSHGQPASSRRPRRRRHRPRSTTPARPSSTASPSSSPQQHRLAGTGPGGPVGGPVPPGFRAVDLTWVSNDRGLGAGHRAVRAPPRAPRSCAPRDGGQSWVGIPAPVAELVRATTTAPDNCVSRPAVRQPAGRLRLRPERAVPDHRRRRAAGRGSRAAPTRWRSPTARCCGWPARCGCPPGCPFGVQRADVGSAQLAATCRCPAGGRRRLGSAGAQRPAGGAGHLRPTRRRCPERHVGAVHLRPTTARPGAARRAVPAARAARQRGRHPRDQRSRRTARSRVLCARVRRHRRPVHHDLDRRRRALHRGAGQPRAGPGTRARRGVGRRSCSSASTTAVPQHRRRPTPGAGPAGSAGPGTGDLHRLRVRHGRAGARRRTANGTSSARRRSGPPPTPVRSWTAYTTFPSRVTCHPVLRAGTLGARVLVEGLADPRDGSLGRNNSTSHMPFDTDSTPRRGADRDRHQGQHQAA